MASKVKEDKVRALQSLDQRVTTGTGLEETENGQFWLVDVDGAEHNIRRVSLSA